MGHELSMSQKLSLAYAALVGGNTFPLVPGVISCKRDLIMFFFANWISS